ncbi:hypothetical protein ABW20_dc0108681 [Dactylellina cionopaga]|nr:hypothetical protein ABW20_dc0108681 [Dactylellina cionopaga]
MSQLTTKTNSPSHSSNPNTDHTTKSGTKPATGIEALTDTSFVPTLESAPLTRYLQSFIVLATMVASVAVAAMFLNFDIFQTSIQQWFILLAVTASLFYTGVVWIDWWTIVVEYWWLSIPILAGMGVAVVRMDEGMRALNQVD